MSKLHIETLNAGVRKSVGECFSSSLYTCMQDPSQVSTMPGGENKLLRVLSTPSEGLWLIVHSCFNVFQMIADNWFAGSIAMCESSRSLHTMCTASECCHCQLTLETTRISYILAQTGVLLWCCIGQSACVAVPTVTWPHCQITDTCAYGKSVSVCQQFNSVSCACNKLMSRQQDFSQALHGLARQVCDVAIYVPAQLSPRFDIM